MSKLEAVEWTGSVAGALGALLIALNLPISGYGFVIFLLSSTSWLVAGMATGNRRLVLMNVAFTLVNLVGIYRWLLA